MNLYQIFECRVHGLYSLTQSNFTLDMDTMEEITPTICTSCHLEKYCILFPQWLSSITRQQTVNGITQAMRMKSNGIQL